jgi:Caspase domain
VIDPVEKECCKFCEQVATILDVDEIRDMRPKYVRERLSELGLQATMPSGLQAAIVAEGLSSPMSNEEIDEISAIDSSPLATVTDELKSLGVNYSPGVLSNIEAVIQFLEFSREARARKAAMARKKRRSMFRGAVIGALAATILILVCHHLPVGSGGRSEVTHVLILEYLRKLMESNTTASFQKIWTSGPVRDEQKKTATLPVAEGNRPPALYVLSVGVGQFEDNAIPASKGAAYEAAYFAKMLQSKSARLFREVYQKVLTDKSATNKAILDGLSWLRQSVEKGDVGVVYLSGQVFINSTGRYYYVAADTNVNEITGTSVSDSEISLTAKKVAGDVIFFFDTCRTTPAVGVTFKGRRSGDKLVSEIVLPSKMILAANGNIGDEKFTVGDWFPFLKPNPEKQPAGPSSVIDGGVTEANSCENGDLGCGENRKVQSWDLVTIGHQQDTSEGSNQRIISQILPDEGIRDCSFPQIR